MSTDKQKEIARRILAGGPPKFDPHSHFDGCPAREGAPICTCGGNRAHEGNTAKPMTKPPTLTDAVRLLIMQTVDSHFGNHYHGRAVYERMKDKLAPALHAADGLRALCWGEMGECCDVDSYDQARDAIIEGAR